MVEIEKWIKFYELPIGPWRFILSWLSSYIFICCTITQHCWSDGWNTKTVAWLAKSSLTSPDKIEWHNGHAANFLQIKTQWRDTQSNKTSHHLKPFLNFVYLVEGIQNQMWPSDVYVEEEKFQSRWLISWHFRDEGTPCCQYHLLFGILTNYGNSCSVTFLSRVIIPSFSPIELRAVCIIIKLTYFGQDKTLGCDAQNERVLTIRELTRPFRTLPCQVFLHEVDMVECAVVKFRVGNQWRARRIVAGICRH